MDPLDRLTEAFLPQYVYSPFLYEHFMIRSTNLRHVVLRSNSARFLNSHTSTSSGRGANMRNLAEFDPRTTGLRSEECIRGVSTDRNH